MITYGSWWWMPVRVGAEREEMKLSERICVLAMGGMLMLLTLMTLGFGA